MNLTLLLTRNPHLLQLFHLLFNHLLIFQRQLRPLLQQLKLAQLLHWLLFLLLFLPSLFQHQLSTQQFSLPTQHFSLPTQYCSLKTQPFYLTAQLFRLPVQLLSLQIQQLLYSRPAHSKLSSLWVLLQFLKLSVLKSHLKIKLLARHQNQLHKKIPPLWWPHHCYSQP